MIDNNTTDGNIRTESAFTARGANPDVLEATQPATRKAPALLWALSGVGVLIVVLLAVILAVLLLRSPDSTDSLGADTAAETFTASGVLDLIGDVHDYGADGCYGANGYDDLHAGAQVVIRDASGKTVRIGELGTGVVPKQYKFRLGAVGCRWPFTVDGVPSGAGPYSVEVSHRGQVSFTEDSASSIGLSLR